MAEEELQVEEGGKKKGKMMLIIIIAVVLLGGGAAAYFLLFAGGDEPAAEQLAETDAAAAAASAPASAAGKAEMGTALYVAMPRPFVLTCGRRRDRLVQIKVQLLVRGSDNEELAKTHIPLIEGTLLQA